METDDPAPRPRRARRARPPKRLRLSPPEKKRLEKQRDRKQAFRGGANERKTLPKAKARANRANRRRAAARLAGAGEDPALLETALDGFAPRRWRKVASVPKHYHLEDRRIWREELAHYGGGLRMVRAWRRAADARYEAATRRRLAALAREARRVERLTGEAQPTPAEPRADARVRASLALAHADPFQRRRRLVHRRYFKRPL